MSRRPRGNHSPAFKARVTLEAAKEEQTNAELSQGPDAHPSKIIQWKKQLLEGATFVFEGNKASEPPVDGNRFHRKIGELTSQINYWYHG